MKKLIKKLIYKNKRIKLINYIFYKRKYQYVGLSLIIINFIFQRILRLNSNTKWMVNFTSRIISPEKITIINYNDSPSTFSSFSSSGGCYIQAINGIEIHKNVLWASGVQIISANHNAINLNEHDKSKPIILNENVWLGAKTIVLPSVEIGKFTIIGAGSVVTKKFPAYTIVAGNPAKILFYRCKKCLHKLENFKCNRCNLIYTKEDYL